MILDPGSWHDNSPSRIIAVKQIEDPGSFRRIARRHFEPIALEQIFNGFRAEVDLGQVSGDNYSTKSGSRG
jgi:hypothetical protein